jgi:hypothetical protein
MLTDAVREFVCKQELRVPSGHGFAWACESI